MTYYPHRKIENEYSSKFQNREIEMLAEMEEVKEKCL